MRREFSAKPSTAVLYARVSSDEQEKEGFSIPAQQKLLKKYAAENGISIVEEYVDVETAKAAGRTGFNEMVEFFERQAKIKDEERRCRTILVEKTDRLYRNLKDYVTLDELRVDIHFVKENVVLSPDSHSSERFMHGIKVLMARQYVDNLSEEVKKGMLEKAEQGIWPSRAPIGYINVERADGKKVIVPDPECAEIITRMFENYAKGTLSLEEVGELAMAEGLPLKREGNFRAVVQYVLRNPIYTGDFQFKGKIYRGIHQPLVSRECWKKVQEKMAERRQRNTRKPKNRESFAFARLIACGHCGWSVSGRRGSTCTTTARTIADDAKNPTCGRRSWRRSSPNSCGASVSTARCSTGCGEPYGRAKPTNSDTGKRRFSGSRLITTGSSVASTSCTGTSSTVASTPAFSTRNRQSGETNRIG